MDRDQIKQIVEEIVERLMEGGPGSGRYPAGSGKTKKNFEKKVRAIKEHNVRMKKKFDEYDKEINKKTRAR